MTIDFLQSNKQILPNKKLPLTSDGGTLIEESDLDMDELSTVYTPDEGEAHDER